MTAPAAGPIRVMIVDDHVLLRNAVREAISAPDVEVVAEAATAEDALRIAVEVRPDVLLLDIKLPGMEGLELVRELAPTLPGTRVVMLTVSTSERDLEAAIRYGAAGYITKDVTAESLLGAVRSAHRGELVLDPAKAAGLVRHLVSAGTRGPAAPGDPISAVLSPRELDILRLVAGGLTDREIAEACRISVRTVETHVGAILRKLGVRNRVEAARRYLEV